MSQIIIIGKIVPSCVMRDNKRRRICPKRRKKTHDMKICTTRKNYLNVFPQLPNLNGSYQIKLY